jgi:hypothetical protein
MRISKVYKLAFVSTPKAGSHSGWKIMEDNFPISDKAMHNNIVPSYAVDYNAFTIVRNPFERAVSLWNSVLWAHTSNVGKQNINLKYRRIFMQKVGSDTFEDFCKFLASDKVSIKKANSDFYIKLLINQYDYHSKTNLNNLTYLKLENIERELPEYIYKNTKKTISIIPHELKRKHNNWADLNVNNCREDIIKWAEKDFEIYGYKPNY